MQINRVWAMPNCQTFQIKPIRELINKSLMIVKLEQLPMIWMNNMILITTWMLWIF